jgi:hypothetical protein
MAGADMRDTMRAACFFASSSVEPLAGSGSTVWRWILQLHDAEMLNPLEMRV